MQNDPTTFGRSPDPELDRVLEAALDTVHDRAVRRVAAWDVEAQLRQALERIRGAADGRSAGAARPAGVRASNGSLVLRGGSGRSARRRWIGAWASVAGMLAVGAVFLFSAGWWGTTGPGQGHAAHAYTTGSGQQAVLTLDDGTRVTLAPRSALRLLNFGARSRMVLLDGEAYFDVKRSGGAPFVVRAGVAQTRVLGTGFLVRHYAGDRRTLIVVASGKVSVSSRTQRQSSLTLVAGGVGEVTDSVVSAMSVGDMTSYTGWVDGRLVFQSAPTNEVLRALSRWYGYEFHLADPSLAGKNLTAVLSTKSSAAVLSTLKLILDVDLAFDGNVVTLTPRRAHAPPAGTRRHAGEELSTHTNEVGR